MTIGLLTLAGVLLGAAIGRLIAEARERRFEYRLWVALGRPPYPIVNVAAPTTTELNANVTANLEETR